jgi:hypothetical protein
MRVPGKAWLQFTALPEGRGTRLLQTALFAPRGLFGLLYWWAMYPAHLFIFGDMARAIGRQARALPPVPSMPARSTTQTVDATGRPDVEPIPGLRG